VVDFGLVKVGEYDQSLTREGVVMGSPHCMAPEQVQGGPIDHRADIYALGVLLFRSITGAYPFHGANATATMMLHLTAEVPRFLDVAPELRVAPGIEAVARRCLARRPEERYPDVMALAQDLARCIGESPQMDTSSQSLTLDDDGPAPARRWPVFVAAIALVGVVALGSAAWLLARSFPPGEAQPPAEVRPIEVAVQADAPASASEADALPRDEAVVVPPVDAASAPTEGAPSTMRPPARTAPPSREANAPKAAEPEQPPKEDVPTPGEGFLGLPDDLK
jgi:serine/threonine-protein kinase